jgi:hypothetical protein
MYDTLINYMHNNIVISVRISDGDTNDFSINIGLNPGLTLNLYLFALIMNEVTQETYIVISLGVYFLHMVWFWWMRVGRMLTRS